MRKSHFTAAYYDQETILGVILVSILNLRAAMLIFFFTLGAFLSKIEPFYHCFFDTAAFLEAILISILNLRVMVPLYVSFDCLRW